MPAELKRPLRNAAKTTGRVNRKGNLDDDSGDDPDYAKFLAMWRRLLEREGASWQGQQAVKELKANGQLDFLLGKNRTEYDFQGEHLFSQIFKETRQYLSEVYGRLKKEDFDKADEFLSKESGRLSKQAEQLQHPGLKRVIKRIKKKVESERKSVSYLKRTEQNWRFSVWDQVWKETPRKHHVSKRIELDTRLQIELAKALGFYLVDFGISVETVARLVLLAYVAAGLAELHEERIVVKWSRRELKVRNIRDVLRRAKLHTTEPFRGSLKSVKK